MDRQALSPPARPVIDAFATSQLFPAFRPPPPVAGERGRFAEPFAVHASSAVRQLALLGAVALAGFAALALHADLAAAGPGAPVRWSVRGDTLDSTRTADSLRAVAALASGDTTLAEVLFARLRASAPGLLTATDTLAGDTLGVAGADSLLGPARIVFEPDSASLAAADTVVADTTRRAFEYLPGSTLGGTGVSVVPRRLPGVRGRLGPYWQREVTLDSAEYAYTVREEVGGVDVRAPALLTLDEFVAAQRRASLSDGFRALASQRADRGRRRAGVGFTVDIPGGEQSAFRTLFGKNEVDLTVNGTSNVDLGASYDRNEARLANQLGGAGTFAPSFDQALNLNVAGTIGDKLRINVNYDTKSTFDFENQVSLVYTGYEDDILQRIEAGNVFLQTPSELIQGGQRLFGLRTDLRFGPLSLTAVASQQDAETNERTVEGGSESTPFSIAPTEYENDTHFFLGYAFHNYWDSAHRQPGLRTLPPGFRELVGIEVWKHEPNLQSTIQTTTDEIITATALADLAEPGGRAVGPGAPPDRAGLSVLRGGEEYLALFSDPRQTPLPNEGIDVYSAADLAEIRDNNSLDIDERFALPPGGSATGRYRRLRETVDYTVDGQLGWLSLTGALNENDFLAVAYQYRVDDGTPGGAIVTVGDFGQGTLDINRRTVLKLLRGNLPAPAAPLWDLTMRNVYRIGGRSLNPTSFSLKLTYEAAGSTALTEFPDVTVGNQQSLLTTFGLDRVNEQGQPTPNDEFDFQVGLTVDVENGRILFPVRQPFGDYLTRLLTTGATLSGEVVSITPTSGSVADAAARYAFEPLYDLKPVQARQQFPGLSRYRIGGEFRSATQSVFPIGFNLVEGTVRVTAAGQNLAENVDYRVNYNAGTLEIVNPTYLQNGQQVRIQFEQNKLFAIGSTTLLGLRADYRLAENTTFGGTLMRLSQRPSSIDKFRVGEELYDNTIAGLDGRYLAEPRWITRALDFLPFLQTRAPSRVELRGEIARLTPGHPETIAFSQTVGRLADAGDAFALPADERGGVSFIDDFEGSETAYSELGEPGGWRLAAPPETSGPAGAISPGGITDPALVTNPLFRSNWRGLFGWYSISLDSYTRTFADRITRATAPVAAGALFPERFRDGQDRTAERNPIGLLDLYFDPSRRGPYNYNRDLGTAVAQNPQTVWGGMIRPIAGNYSDFEGDNNIEFVEMLLAAVGGRNGTEPIQPGARMYLDLGRMNEDVVPNAVTSTEDGLRDGGTPQTGELDAFARRTQGQTNGAIDLFESGRTEDVGLDGLPSSVNDVVPGSTLYDVSEQTRFTAFLDGIPNGPTAEIARRDPSFDDYHHFRDAAWFDNPALFPGTASIQERFSQYFPATELNSTLGQGKIRLSGSDTPGISVLPNTEDINGNLTVDFTEVFHRYEIPLDAAGLQASPFFENTVVVQGGPANGETFYLLRIPVRTENRVTSAGLDRDDFSRIEAVRLWTTGHDRPATVRMASFQLVGSQWLQSERVGTAEDIGAPPPGPDPRLFVATINNEESPTTYAIPRQAVYRTTAASGLGGGAGGLARDKALVLRAEDLADGRTAAVTRSYATRPIDFTRYSNVRMYIHGHGFERSDSMRVVVRLGDDETENYYEYEQPISPFSIQEAARLSSDEVRADSLWQTATPQRADRNSVNIVLAELNKLKVARDEAGAPITSVYRSTSAPEGAPRGARIAVRGQPSIQDVRTIVLGVRNGRGGRVVPVDTVEVWFNELRVSGYDEDQGTSGFLTANVVLADVGTVTARFSQTQDGFGALGGGLGEREFSDRTALSLTSQFNAHRLLPERFGWSIPVSYSLTANEATPRYDPRRGDIRLSELVDRATEVAAEPGAAPAAISPQQIVERAQSVTGTRNFRIQASKTGSRSPYLRYTIDGLTAAYTSTAQTARNPSSELNDADSWAANFAYRVAVPRPKTIRPFWFTGGLPLARVLSGLRLNVLPQTISFATDARRNIAVTRSRLDDALLAPEPEEVRRFRNLPRRTQLFDHGRQLDLQYNPFPFLQLSYGSSTDQDLGGAGQNESFQIYVRNAAGKDSTFSISPAAARDPNSIVRQFFRIDDSAEAFNALTVLGGSELDVRPVGETLAGILSGERALRTRGYQQSLTAALRLSLARVRWLSWIRPQALSYQTSYQWTDVPIANQPELVVAGAGTRVSLQSGLQIVPTEFWRLFPFYRRLEASAGRGPGGGQAPPPPRAGQAPDSTAARRPLFRPGAIGRDLFLAATGLTDVSVTYRGAFSSSVGGLVGDSYSLLSGLRGVAPSVGYRLGLSRSIPLDRRLADPTVGLQYSDQLSDRHTFEARSTVEPFRSLRVGLTWQTTFEETERLPYAYLPIPGEPDLATVSALPSDRRGSGASTVYAFGGSYNSLLVRHQQRLLDDIAAAPTEGDAFTSEYLLRTGLADDFQTEFSRGIGAFGPRGVFAIPVPGWDITYSGLAGLPIIKAIAQQITLRHNYSATSEASYSSFFTADPARRVLIGSGADARPFTLVAPAVVGTDGSSEANAITVNERFQPLLGASLGLRGGVQADVTWNRSNLYTLQTTSNQLTEKAIEDVQVNLSYAKTGLRLLGLRRLNNNLRLSVTASLGSDQTYLRNIRTDLDEILRGTAVNTVANSVEPVSLRRIQIAPRIGYTVSNQVTADVFVRYERTDPRGGTNPFSTSSFDGGVSLRILFSN